MSHRRLYILINIDFYFALENNVVDGLRWGGGGGAGLNVGRFFCIVLYKFMWVAVQIGSFV